MLDVLKDAVRHLDVLMQNSVWYTVNVNYHPPMVHRMWRTLDNGHRLYLHKIFPPPMNREAAIHNGVDPDTVESLYHPHPWPSAIMLVKGQYEQAFGYGHPKGSPPKQFAKMIVRPGTMYEMVNPCEWHYVKPLFEPSLSIMVTGKPYNHRLPNEPRLELPPLTETEKDQLFYSFYTPNMMETLNQWV